MDKNRLIEEIEDGAIRQYINLTVGDEFISLRIALENSVGDLVRVNYKFLTPLPHCTEWSKYVLDYFIPNNDINSFLDYMAYWLNKGYKIRHCDLFEGVLARLSYEVSEKILDTYPIKLSEKPPLGITPRFILNEQRIGEILEGMVRFNNARVTIPDEWIKELKDLTKAGV